jgi:hypothetical protein
VTRNRVTLPEVGKASFQWAVHTSYTDLEERSGIVSRILQQAIREMDESCRRSGKLPLWQTLNVVQDIDTGLSGVRFAPTYDDHMVRLSVMTIPWDYDETPGGTNPPALGRDTVETPSQKD